MRRLVLLFLALTSLFAAPVALARAADSAPVVTLPNTSVGRVEGTQAFIGLSLDGDRLRVYVCNGTAKRKATLSQWFKGRWDGRAALTLRAGRHVLRIESVKPGGVITGRFDSHRFRVESATGLAGVFERTEQPLKGSWISLGKDHLRGVVVDRRPPRKCFVVATSSGTVIVCN